MVASPPPLFDETTPAFMDHGNGIHTIVYYWRDAAWALSQFCKRYPNLQITAMMEEKKDKGGKITLVTEQKEISGYTQC